ncbi:unnamed protein product [Protopolystoma xenopodis]|uniref:Uncharacterized protein n=1 Tax=Protopolystoma xenopodis TaxID=117903 RepID=A0A448WE27_9PLAT|nr:unnamed protein product [Protopolystoma xenopodis]
MPSSHRFACTTAWARTRRAEVCRLPAGSTSPHQLMTTTLALSAPQSPSFVISRATSLSFSPDLPPPSKSHSVSPESDVSLQTPSLPAFTDAGHSGSRSSSLGTPLPLPPTTPGFSPGFGLSSVPVLFTPSPPQLMPSSEQVLVDSRLSPRVQVDVIPRSTGSGRAAFATSTASIALSSQFGNSVFAQDRAPISHFFCAANDCTSRPDGGFNNDENASLAIRPLALANALYRISCSSESVESSRAVGASASVPFVTNLKEIQPHEAPSTLAGRRKENFEDHAGLVS